MVIFIVVRQGRKSPSAPEFGTPHYDVCRGWFGNVQFSRVRITNLSQEIQGAFLGNLVIIELHKEFCSPDLQVAYLSFLNQVIGDYFEETKSHFKEMKCCWFYEIIVKESKILFSILSLCTVPSKGSSHEARQWQMNISFIQKGQIAILYPSSWGNFSCLFWLKGSLTLGGRQLPKMQAPGVKSSSHHSVPAHTVCTPVSELAVSGCPPWIRLPFIFPSLIHSSRTISPPSGNLLPELQAHVNF